GTTVRINKGTNDRVLSVSPGPDGLMDFPFNPTDKDNWDNNPNQRHAGGTMVPLSGKSAWAPALGPTHMGWMSQRDGSFENLPTMTVPDVWITFRTNPLNSYWDLEELEKITAEFPFHVSFAYTHDETNHFADILLPECTDLETYRLARIGRTSFIEVFSDYHGFALLQPAVAPQGDARDMTWIFTELAKRTGLLEDYNEAINRGTVCVPLKTENYDHSLDVTKEHSVEEIWDALCKAASGNLTEGKESDGLDYYRRHGFRLAKFPRLHWYLYPFVEDQGLRFEMPYQERLRRIGCQLGNRLHEQDITWWDKQIEEYRAMPTWHDIPGIWEQALEKNFNCKIEDFPFWVVTTHSMQYSWGSNAGIPLMKEVANNIAGHKGVIINRGKAKDLGINDGDLIDVTSPNGQSVCCRAVTRQGIRPDVLLMLGQFGHWKTPVAKDFDQPSMNKLIPMLLDTTDNTGSGADLAKVKVTKVGNVGSWS
ncbi:MAG: molybdopterin-dependent oxidoreductase, partial [Fimbriimonadaceae bacterium]|nr:molybdopterin-dependent oxidoreductase [Alphaproteobacteria bacterium]